MPKLSEVLGAIVKDISHAQVTSDMVSLEYAKYYQQDALLKHITSPSIKIKNIEVKLKFLVSETSISKGLSEDAKVVASNIWSEHVQTNFIPRVIDGLAKNITIDRSELGNIVKTAIKVTKKPSFDINNILAGKTRNNKTITENYFTAVVKSLPSDIRKQLPNLTGIKKSVREQYDNEFKTLSPQMKKVAIAKTAENFDLDIAVTKDELANADESEVQEISMEIVLEDNL
ncbi:MAG: hypothetical protein HOJ79_14360 [Nitrospina sp.]|jgi:hypothetical protein|nr:hypothetical protein [Nitrospina sp.]